VRRLEKMLILIMLALGMVVFILLGIMTVFLDKI